MLADTLEKPGTIETYQKFLAELGSSAATAEGLAIDSANFLFNRFNEAELNSCALVRFFRTMPLTDLPPTLQKRAIGEIGYKPKELVNCLTLLATRGIEPAWNERTASTNHQVIPLNNERVIEDAPMVAALLQNLGLSFSQVVKPTPNKYQNPKSKSYNVLYVPEASENSSIVSQETFVKPYKIRSVIGFGGMLPSGDVFAVMAFMREFVPESTAMRFSLFARGVEIGLSKLTKTSGARILIAGERDLAESVSAALSTEQDLVVASTVDEAMNLVSQEIFDMIICAVDFDESRMFEFLQAVKQDANQKPKPFLCITQTATRMTKTAPTAAIGEFGGAYIDISGKEKKSLTSIVESYLPVNLWINEG